MRLGTLLTITFSLAIAFAAPRTETGDINGARFRIDIPENWNGGLVMYCHGYSPLPVTYEKPELAKTLVVFLDQGYALAQSGYAAGGWAIQEAETDTENLRRYFVRKYGPVKETYVTGHSMGGFLTMVLMETSPSVYDAGLPLCGPLGAPNWFMARGAFDGRVLFDYYFPGALPDPSRVDADFKNTPEVAKRIEQLLDSAPEKAAILRRQNNLKNNKDLGSTLSFVTYLLKELQERTGGNPFDNRNVIYTGTPDDNALNAGVKRYSADLRAAAYLRTYYTPTGRISKPMLAVHTSYDPLVPASIPNMYESLVEQAGTAGNFVQQYVKHDGFLAVARMEVERRAAKGWRIAAVDNLMRTPIVFLLAIALDVPITPASPFYMAPVSKQFAAMSIRLLAAYPRAPGELIALDKHCFAARDGPGGWGMEFDDRTPAGGFELRQPGQPAARYERELQVEAGGGG
jgi:pimeloyl-ACP methyl ester carboxylesterase